MQKISTATVTFHASHNYGSMLQAYALQQTLLSLGVDNEIINLRTKRQKTFYPKPNYIDTSSIRRIVKSIIMLPYTNSLRAKYDLFEEYLRNYLKLTEEYTESTEITDLKIKKYDYLVAGSDQIWNTICVDFDWLYYLPIANKNAIAYAPSMGPHAKEQVDKGNYNLIEKHLNNFIGLSVREEGTANLIEEISGRRPDILVDPTMLLNKSKWELNINNTPLVKGKYLFIYSPWLSSEILKTGKRIAKLLNLEVVISNFSVSNLLDAFGCKKVLACGPWEFLNLIKHSSLVLSGSFHAVVFSILLQKPFFALNGDTDNRICHILSRMGLEKRVVHSDNIADVIPYAFDIDFTKSLLELKKERTKSINFLKNHLNIV